MAISNSFPVIKRLESADVCGAVAARFARTLRAGDLLLFTGEIGAGKTTFIQALAKSLGVTETVTSPTFVLQATYESGRVPFSHVDLYRLDTDLEIESIGFEEYFDVAVTAVEWADRYSKFQPPNVMLNFAYGELENERILTMTPNGGDWEARLSALDLDVD